MFTANMTGHAVLLGAVRVLYALSAVLDGMAAPRAPRLGFVIPPC